jgi:hypothetical protein
MAGKVALAPGDLGWFTTTLANIIARARSLSDIETWLREQPFIASVTVADYLLKSNPPQREIFLEIKMTSGGTEKRILRILELDPARFQFHIMREP